MSKEKKKVKRPKYPLSKKEFLKAFVSELRESENEFNFKLIREISKDILEEKVTPEQGVRILDTQEKELYEKMKKKYK